MEIRGMLPPARGCPRLGEAMKDPPLQPSRACGPASSLVPRLRPPDCEEMHACLLLKPPSVRRCCGSPGKGTLGVQDVAGASEGWAQGRIWSKSAWS